MLAPLKVPLATAVYTLVGILLASWWFAEVYWPVWLAAALAVALAFGLAPLGRRLVTTRPRQALRVFESYAWVNGLLTAVATSATVLVTVSLTAAAGTDDPIKELVTQASAAITALIGGVVVATKDADETLGTRIAKEFQACFTVVGQEEPGKVALRPESPSLLAVFTKYANGWTDWSKDNREARVAALSDHLAADRA